MTALLGACFFVSGAAALALEMLWMRSAALVFGGTATTAAAVLACWFAGLALGAALGDAGAARPIRRYALLELAAAGGALWALAVFDWLATDGGLRLLGDARAPLRLLAIAVAVLPSTVCWGATLPVLGDVLAAGAAGRRGGLLYAVNTLGAAAGAAAAGFGLPLLVGVRACHLLAAAAAATAGLAALAVARAERAAATPPDVAGGTSATRPAAPRPRVVTAAPRLLVVAGTTGGLGLGLEVLWTRLFAQVLHNSVYSFTAVTVVFLVAIAAGAALAALLLRVVDGERLAGAALVAAGVASVGGWWAFTWWTDGLAYVGMTTGLGEYVVRILVLAAATAGPAVLAGAAVLPALWEASDAPHATARALGRVAAANAVGGALGALAAGFVVLPLLGVRSGLLLAAVGYLVCVGLLPRAGTSVRRLAAAALVLVVVGDPLRAPLARLAPDDGVRATLEGQSGIVSVVDAAGDLQLRLDGYYRLGGSAALANERRQGLLPLLLHADPRRVLFVGLATGITASAAPALGVPDTTVVELVPEVAAAARAHFGAWNDDLLARADVRLVVDDGRHFLRTTTRRFDVIVSDLFVPWHAGAGTLYARETFDAAARRLAPGGLFCQWLPLYQLTREDFDVVARTFLAVFPHVTLWRDDFYADRPVVALVGRRAPARLDRDRLAARLAALPSRWHDPLLRAPRALAMLYAGDLSAAADLFADAPLNTDDRPVVEFTAPRLTRTSSAGDKDWFVGAPLADFYAALAARPRTAAAFVPDDADTDGAVRAGAALFRWAVAVARHDDDGAARSRAEVRALVPDVIAAADAPDGGDATFAALRREQSDLRREMADMERRLRALTADGAGDR
jgi:spermidine synthase